MLHCVGCWRRESVWTRVCWRSHAWRDWSTVFKGYAGAEIPRQLDNAAKAAAPIPNTAIMDENDRAASTQLYWMVLMICKAALVLFSSTALGPSRDEHSLAAVVAATTRETTSCHKRQHTVICSRLKTHLLQRSSVFYAPTRFPAGSATTVAATPFPRRTICYMRWMVRHGTFW